MEEVIRLNKITRIEAEIIENCNKCIYEIKNQLLKKDYKSLNLVLAELQKLSLPIEEMDIQRDEAFKNLAKSLDAENLGFHETIVKLPPELRDSAYQEFRNLKLSLSKFKSEMWIIENMLTKVQGMLNYVVNESQRVKDSGCYTNGLGSYNSLSAGSRPIVLNQTI